MNWWAQRRTICTRHTASISEFQLRSDAQNYVTYWFGNDERRGSRYYALITVFICGREGRSLIYGYLANELVNVHCSTLYCTARSVCLIGQLRRLFRDCSAQSCVRIWRDTWQRDVPTCDVITIWRVRDVRCCAASVLLTSVYSSARSACLDSSMVIRGLLLADGRYLWDEATSLRRKAHR